MPRLCAAPVLLALLFIPSPAFSQDPPAIIPLEQEPIAPYVLDARGTMARLKPVAAIGTSLGVDANTTLPTRGFGLVVGGHVYPIRRGSFALGLGGELLLRTQGSRTAPATSEDGPEGPTVKTRFSALSPQVSLNFGKREGYSYISGGMGWASLTSELVQPTTPTPPGPTPTTADDEARRQTINYGGGARWFIKKHVAFSLDLRFYAVRPREETATVPAYPRMTVMVFSAGIAIR
jgi:hypothetical protein